MHYNSPMREYFQPQIELEREPDGEYTLHAVTLVPNSAYSAGRARVEIPPMVRLVPEVLPVILQLRVRRGRSRQVPTLVRHRLRNLKLGPEHGKTTVTAFVMVRDELVGSSSTPVQTVHECPPKDRVTVDTSDWYAWLSKMPPGPASFHVTGVVHLPSPGYETRLVKAAPQGINPRELILDLEVKPRPGIWPQVITPVSVRYDEESAGVEYTGVLVREPDGDAVQLDVDVVH